MINLFKSKPKKDEVKKTVQPTALEGTEQKVVENTTTQAQTVQKAPLLPSFMASKEIATKTVFSKIPEEKKITIILVENTDKVVKEKETLIKLVKSVASKGLVSIINYGADVRQSKFIDISTSNDISFLYEDDIDDTACLYDALVYLQSMVSKEHLHFEEDENIRISKIEIIGIGTCKDGCSRVSKEVAIDCFVKVNSTPKVTTKYFCLTEESFINAAEIGFHSIGSISRNY